MGHKVAKMTPSYLRKETEADENQESVAVARRRPQLAPRVLLVLLLERDGLLDLVELDIDQRVVLVALCVVLGQNLLGLGGLPVGDEPAGRLGHEPDEGDLEQGRDGLQQAGRAPRPVADDVVGAERDPGPDERAQVPEGVVDGRVDGAVLRVDELGDEEGRGPVGDGDAEAEQEAPDDEEGDVEAEGEQCDADDHDSTPNHDSHPPSQEISCESISVVCHKDNLAWIYDQIVPGLFLPQYGTKGMASMLPMLIEAVMRPRMDGLGSLK